MSNLKPMEFGDIFSYTFRILRHKYWHLYLAMGWLYVPLGLAYSYFSYQTVGQLFGAPGQLFPPVGFDTLLRTYLFMFLYLLLQQILKPLTGAGAVFIVARTLHGEEYTLGEVFGAIFSRWTWLKLLAAGAVVTAGMVMGVLALVLPALLLFVTLSLVTQAVTLEGAGVWRALSRSWSMVWRDIGKVLLVLLVMTVLTYVVTGIVTTPITVATLVMTFLEVDQALWYILLSLLSGFLGLLVAPVPVIAMTLLYFDLRARREGLDLEQRIGGIGAAAAPESG